MCFILNLLKSCSFKKKSTSSSSSSVPSTISIPNEPSTNSINHKNQLINTIANLNPKNLIVTNLHLNEKTPLDYNYHTRLNSSKNNKFETILKEKLLKSTTNIKHYSKLESESDSFAFSPYTSRSTSISSDKRHSKNNNNSNIVDYCNECSYYCCECKSSQSISTTNKFNSNQHQFYIDNCTFNYYLNLNNNNNDSVSLSQNCKTIYCQPQAKSGCDTLNLTRCSSINSTHKNKMKSFSKETNIKKKAEINLVLSSQSSLASSSTSTTTITSSSLNRLNPFINTNDFDLKLEDNTNTKLEDIPFEKPNLNLFTQRNNNNDVIMIDSYHQAKLQQPLMRPKLDQSVLFGNTSTKLLKQPSDGLTIDFNQFKKQKFIFSTDQVLYAKPIEPEDSELSLSLDNELNNSRSDHMIDDESPVNRINNNNPFYQQHYLQQSNQQQQKNLHVEPSDCASSNRARNHRRKHRDGKLIISKDQVYEFKESNLEDLGQIGYGEFGTVHKVLHIPSQTCMALKRIRPTVGSQGERKKILKELDFVLECHDCTHVVKFYGVKLNNEPAENLICMELMDTSLEKFYKFVYEKKHEEIPESILGKIVVATVNALNYLKESHRIIHRDVKPSNILINKQGEIKMCDFGISGKLVDSIAASRDAGCQLYMAPERINPLSCTQGYDVRSDVWSLGITLYELSTGRFPYPQWKTIFHQLNLVVENDAPRLEAKRLSENFRNFVNTCLTKDEKKRPKYKELLQHPLILSHQDSNINISAYVTSYINEMQQ